jgi:excinuclease ABC subunit A
MEASDYLVELGEKAGKNGGKVIFSGNLSEMKKSKSSLTGQYLIGEKSNSNQGQEDPAPTN